MRCVIRQWLNHVSHILSHREYLMNVKLNLKLQKIIERTLKWTNYFYMPGIKISLRRNNNSIVCARILKNMHIKFTDTNLILIFCSSEQCQILQQWTIFKSELFLLGIKFCRNYSYFLNINFECIIYCIINIVLKGYFQFFINELWDSNEMFSKNVNNSIQKRFFKQNPSW